MVVDEFGYKFDVKTDILGQLGIKEVHNVVYRGDTVRLNLTCTVDNKGSIIMPVLSNPSLGFKPISSKIDSKDELTKFIRSNKPIFGRLDNMGMIASGVLVFDIGDMSLLSSDDFYFYIPKMVVENNTLVSCDRLSSAAGVNMFKVSDVTLSAYKSALVACLDKEAILSREGYIGSFLNKEG